VGEVGDGRELVGGGATRLAASQVGAVRAAECIGVNESLEDVAARADGGLVASRI